jgi:hypothetical protein
VAKRRSEQYKQVKKVLDKARRELKRDHPSGPYFGLMIRFGVLYTARRSVLDALPLIEGGEWEPSEALALERYIQEIVHGVDMLTLHATDDEEGELFESEATATGKVATLCHLALFEGHTGFEAELAAIEEHRQWGPAGKPDDYIEEPEDLRRITGWITLLNTLAQKKRAQGWSEERVQEWVAEREREHEERLKRREEGGD